MKQKRSEQEVTFARAQGRKIYDLRNKRTLTRRQLADMTGVNEWHIYRIEMGDSMATAFQIDAIATALAASREELFPAVCQVVSIRSTAISIGRRRVYA